MHKFDGKKKINGENDHFALKQTYIFSMIHMWLFFNVWFTIIYDIIINRELCI